MNMQRFISGILALSGAVFALMTWIIPPFWPGYLVWLGWIFIACGSRTLSKRWFWLVSTIWNAGMLWLFLSDTDWNSENKAMIYWYARVHVLVATVASAVLCVRFPPSFQREKKEPNKAQEPTPSSVVAHL